MTYASGPWTLHKQRMDIPSTIKEEVVAEEVEEEEEEAVEGVEDIKMYEVQK